MPGLEVDVPVSWVVVGVCVSAAVGVAVLWQRCDVQPAMYDALAALVLQELKGTVVAH